MNRNVNSFKGGNARLFLSFLPPGFRLRTVRRLALLTGLKPTGKLLPALLLIAASTVCSIQPVGPHTTDGDALDLLPAGSTGIEDGRGRFREIFCTVMEDHGHDVPDYRPCEEALTRVGKEPPGTGDPVNLGPSGAQFLVGLVPGLAWQCVRKWLDEDNAAPRHVAQYGFDVRLFEVDGTSSSDNNARQIRDHVVALSAEDKIRPFILMGYSKGTVDILQAVVTYPEVRDRVVAVVSVAGAVGGSPLADNMKQSRVDMLSRVPRSGCETGDSGAVASLQPEVRKNWLANNTLPDNIRYYSVIAFPDPDRVSLGLKFAYQEIGKVDARNDGQLIFYDQFIPAATLLAFTNADHWAMSTPVARQLPIMQATFANRSDYPQEVLLEAILRYVEEDLAKGLISSPM